MERKYLVIFLILVLIVGSSKEVMNHLSYTLNKDYIARVLCVNKEVPESTCNGKCFMKKNMADEEPKDNTTLPSNTENIPNIIFTFLKETNVHRANTLLIKKASFSSILQMNGSDYISDIFHPPQLS